jgi:hypothetical protein
MECTLCGEWVEENKIFYDYVGNEHCEKCLDDETNKKR